MGKQIIRTNSSQLAAFKYLLKNPTESNSSKSKQKSNEQVIRTSIERFAIPEIIFNPSDIGVMQMGLPEAIMFSVSKCPDEYQLHLLRNILLIGGNFFFPNIKERVEYDLRRLAPDDLEVHTTLPENPITYSCSGGVDWCSSSEIKKSWVTLQEYQEYGKNICLKKFHDI